MEELNNIETTYISGENIDLFEEKRNKVLTEFEIMDTPNEEEYDAITKLASIICNKPICTISLLDHNRQWFKSKYGLPPEITESPKDSSFCKYTIKNKKFEIFEVNDSNEDPRFAKNIYNR